MSTSRLSIPSLALLRGYHARLLGSYTLACSAPWVPRLPSGLPYPRLLCSVGTTPAFWAPIPSLALLRGYHARLPAPIPSLALLRGYHARLLGSHTLTCSAPWVPRPPSGLPYPRASKKHSPLAGRLRFSHSFLTFYLLPVITKPDLADAASGSGLCPGNRPEIPAR